MRTLEGSYIEGPVQVGVRPAEALQSDGRSQVFGHNGSKRDQGAERSRLDWAIHC